MDRGAEPFVDCFSPSLDSTEWPHRVGPTSWSGSPSLAPHQHSQRGVQAPHQHPGPSGRADSIPTFTPPQPAKQAMFRGTPSLQSRGPGARGRLQPHTPSALQGPPGSAEGQRAPRPEMSPGVPAGHAACTGHTASSGQASGVLRPAGHGTGAKPGPGPSAVPPACRRAVGRAPQLQACPLEGQRLLRGELGGRADEERVGSSPASTGTPQAALVRAQKQ